MQSSDLLTLTTPEQIESGLWRWSVPDTWQQGRGVFGGLVMATVVRALEAEVAVDDQPLRSLTATLCGPVLVGEAQVRVEALRRGNNTTTLEARVEQDGEVKTHVVGLFGRRRVEDGDWNVMTPPEMPPWREIPNPAPVGPPLAPTFTQHYAFRPLDSALPFSGAELGQTGGWIMPRRGGAVRDTAYLAASIDAWWPAHLVTETSFRPMATISYTLEILGRWDGLDPDAPLFYQARSPVAMGGYATEFRELWGEDGRLMALNQQVFAIIK